MNLATLAWLAMAGYALHILEEYTFNWRDWARAVLKLPVEWSDFYVTNAVVIAVGIAQAMLSPTLPWAPLLFASVMLINAVFFHIVPVVRFKGRYSPGVATAVVLFLPVAIAMWKRATDDGALDPATIIIAVGGGALAMAFPIVMLLLRSKPYFRQE
ncbi:MAG: HXXEE domain-containing protein [Xanthobacteraceae bacterium]